MKTKSEIIEHHIQNVKRTVCWSPADVYRGKGGQSVALPPTGVYLESPDSGFCIFVNNERSQIKNYELAYTLFRLYLEETVLP